MGLLLISALTHECRLSTGNAAESTVSVAMKKYPRVARTRYPLVAM